MSESKKYLIDEILAALNDIKASIAEVEQTLEGELTKLRGAVERLTNSGLPMGIVEIYLSKKTGIGVTKIRQIINAIKKPRYSAKDLLIQYIAKNAAVKNTDVKRFFESYEALLRELAGE